MTVGLLVLAAVLWAGAPAPALGQGLADDASGSGSGGPPAWAYSLAHDLMSPFCPGRTLAACPSPQADQLRQWILFQASAGQTRTELEETLYERFGDVILSSPKAEGGWGVSAYAIPIGAFLLGGPLVAFAIFRLARKRDTQAPTVPADAPPADAPAADAPPAVGAAAGIRPGRTGPGPSDEELGRLVDEEFARF